MKTKTRTAFLAAFAGLVPALATAQSLPTHELPEIARQLRSEREGTGVATRIFTNENIRNAGRDLAAASRTRPAAPGPETGPETGDEELADAVPTVVDGDSTPLDGAIDEELVGGRTEAQWRAAFAAAREEIRRAEDRLTLAQQELQTLDRRLLTESSLYNREGQLGPMIAGKREEIAAAEQRVQAGIDAMVGLQTEFRTVGGPAGWAR